MNTNVIKETSKKFADTFTHNKYVVGDASNPDTFGLKTMNPKRLRKSQKHWHTRLF